MPCTGSCPHGRATTYDAPAMPMSGPPDVTPDVTPDNTPGITSRLRRRHDRGHGQGNAREVGAHGADVTHRAVRRERPGGQHAEGVGVAGEDGGHGQHVDPPAVGEGAADEDEHAHRRHVLGSVPVRADGDEHPVGRVGRQLVAGGPAEGAMPRHVGPEEEEQDTEQRDADDLERVHVRTLSEVLAGDRWSRRRITAPDRSVPSRASVLCIPPGQVTLISMRRPSMTSRPARTIPSRRRCGASVPTRWRSRASGSISAAGGPIRKSSYDGKRSTAPTISPSRTKSRLLPVSTDGRYSCTITCRVPRAVADSTSERVFRSWVRRSQTSMPAKPSTGLRTVVPWVSANSSTRSTSAVTSVFGHSSGKRSTQSFSCSSRTPLGRLTTWTPRSEAVSSRYV